MDLSPEEQLTRHHVELDPEKLPHHGRHHGRHGARHEAPSGGGAPRQAQAQSEAQGKRGQAKGGPAASADDPSVFPESLEDAIQSAPPAVAACSVYSALAAAASVSFTVTPRRNPGQRCRVVCAAVVHMKEDPPGSAVAAAEVAGASTASAVAGGAVEPLEPAPPNPFGQSAGARSKL